MPSRVQTLRSSVAGSRPSAGSREVGELYTNFADRQIGYIDAAKAPIDLLAVRFFSTSASYAAGDVALQAGALYRAKVPVSPAAFNGANWDAYVVQSGVDASLALKLDVTAYTAADVLIKIKTVDGAGSGLDADLLDGQDGAYYLALANGTGAISDAQHGNRGGGSLHAAATAAVAGFMTDAPSDSSTYGRKNGAWSVTAAGLPEAPNDANAYVRSALAWAVGYTKAATDTLLGAKIGDAPSDGNEYIRVNGVWRLSKQSFTPTGSAGQNITVPATARAARILGKIYTSTQPTAPIMRWSADGSTFLSGASDYTYGGTQTFSGSGTSPTKMATTNASAITLCPTTDNLTIPAMFEIDLVVNKPASPAIFTARWRGAAYHSAAASIISEILGYAYTGNAALQALTQMPAFQIAPSGGNWVAGTLIQVEWVY